MVFMRVVVIERLYCICAQKFDIFYVPDRSKAVLLLWIFYVFFCLVFAMSLYVSVYMCFVVTCWARADLLALVCGVLL